jgi:hypothetical protein
MSNNISVIIHAKNEKLSLKQLQHFMLHNKRIQFQFYIITPNNDNCNLFLPFGTVFNESDFENSILCHEHVQNIVKTNMHQFKTDMHHFSMEIDNLFYVDISYIQNIILEFDKKPEINIIGSNNMIAYHDDTILFCKFRESNDYHCKIIKSFENIADDGCKDSILIKKTSGIYLFNKPSTKYFNTEIKSISQTDQYNLLLNKEIDTLSDIFRPITCEKTIDICIYGCTDINKYPLTNRLTQLLPQYFNVAICKSKLSDIQLTELINTSRICIVETSDNSYLSKKMFEIASCGSVLCGSINKQARSIFQYGIIELTKQMTDYEIVRILTYYLNNAQILENMSKNNLKISTMKTNSVSSHRLIHLSNEDISSNIFAKFNWNRIPHTDHQWSNICIASNDNPLIVDRMVSIFGMQTFDNEFIEKKRMLHNPCETLILIGFHSPIIMSREYDHLFKQFNRIILVFTEENISEYTKESIDLTLSIVNTYKEKIKCCAMNYHVKCTLKNIHDIDASIVYFPLSPSIQTHNAVLKNTNNFSIACHIDSTISKKYIDLILNVIKRLPAYVFNIYGETQLLGKPKDLPANIHIEDVLKKDIQYLLQGNVCSLKLSEFCAEHEEGINALLLGLSFVYNHDMSYATKTSDDIDEIVEKITSIKQQTYLKNKEIQEHYVNLYSCKNFEKTLNFFTKELINPVDVMPLLNLTTRSCTMKLNRECRYCVYILGNSSLPIQLVIDGAKEVDSRCCNIETYNSYSYVDFVPKMGNVKISLKLSKLNIDRLEIKEFKIYEIFA